MSVCRASVVVFAVLLLATAASARGLLAKYPAGSVVAHASIGPVSNTTSDGKGKATLILPPGGHGNATLEVNLSGSLQDLTMSHIHLWNATLGNPIVVDLLPTVNAAAPVLLNPPLSYKGKFSFVASFSEAKLAVWTPGMTFAKFVSLLSKGKLYVNVHTKAYPGGALQGTLECKTYPCTF